MSDESDDNQQTFGEAISTLMSDVEEFERYVERSKRENPEHWPDTMSEADWFEQFMMFMSNGSHEGTERRFRNPKFEYRVRETPFETGETSLTASDQEMQAAGWERRYADVMLEGVFAVYRRARKPVKRT